VNQVVSQPRTDETPTAGRRGSEFAELSRRMRATGLLGRRPVYYTVKISVTALLFAAAWAVFVVVGHSWWQLFTGVALGLLATQVAFLGHDAGHKQVFRTRKASYVLGLLHANVAVGLSFGWWMDKHSRHHANPNHEDLDPDVQTGALVLVPGEARRRRLTRLLTRAQAYYFFPLLLLEGLNLHVASMLALRERPPGRRALEAVLLVAHIAGYLAVVLWMLSPLQALAFVAVQQGVFGVYMGCSFAPNHKGMPILSAEDDLDYLRRQVITSRNIRGGRVVDFVFGGLNYQIEHHLFPSMPRPNLRRAQAIVSSFCHERRVPYQVDSLIGSYRQTLRHLGTASGPLPADPPAPPEPAAAVRSRA
jgi:fatty acid desaturase